MFNHEDHKRNTTIQNVQLSSEKALPSKYDCTDQYHAKASVFSGFHRSEVKTGSTLIALLALYLFDEADETAPEAPRLVAITLQRADRDLLRLLHRHRHHVHGVVHQRCIRLRTGR